MALRLEQKQTIVAEVGAEARKAHSAVLADFRGLTVVDMTELRAKARREGVYLRVVRNSLARRAVAGTDYECLNDALEGPTLLALSLDEPGSAARLIKACADEYEALEVKALAIGGTLLAASEIDRVAKLPTRSEALALLMSVMLAPAAKLVRTLNEVPAKLVRTLAAVSEAKSPHAGAQTGAQAEDASEAEATEAVEAEAVEVESADEASADEASASEDSADVKPVNEQAADKVSADEASANEASSDVKPEKEQAAKKQAAKKRAAKKQSEKSSAQDAQPKGDD